MRGPWLTERRVALICAIVLVVVSVTAAWRYNAQQQAAHEPSGQSSEQQQPPISIDGQPSADTSDTSSAPDTSKPAAPLPAQPPATQQHTYNYTAVAGSSYTEFVRQAMASYIDAQQLTVSPVTQTNAEVAVVNAAGAPLLEIGQQVSVARADIAQALSAEGATAAPTPAPKPAQSTDTAFVAQAGDSYTGLVRQAIARYAAAQSLSLSTAQRVAVETYVVQQAGEPQLAVGQQVAISEEAIQQAVQHSRALSAAELAAWQPYADKVAW